MSKNFIDDIFEQIKKIVTSRTEAELAQLMGACYNNWVKNTPEGIVKGVLDWHESYAAPMWGKFVPEKGEVEMLYNRAHALVTRWNEFETLYNRLADYRSKRVLAAILENWVTFSFKGIEGTKEYCFKPYFDLDILTCDEEDVVVDLGAYIGDTIADYYDTYGKGCCKKIYAYEIMPQNIAKIEENFGDDPKVIIRPVGVSNKSGYMYFADNNTSDAQFLVEEGEISCETVTLDEDIKEPITLLKTDIEGGEMAALEGARRHIVEDKPKLAISAYHSNTDLLDIVNRIDEYQPGYTFYLRYNGVKWFATDYVLIGIYEEKEK